jgi:hypothetical protein
MWQQWNLFRTRDSELIESLRSLPHQYDVLHDLIVPECRDRVDHVVLGPNGVFVIETTDCAGELKCAGHDWSAGRRRVASLSRQVEIKAAALRKSLVAATYEGENKIPCITPVLVFTNSQARVTVREPAVPAMGTGELAAFILRYKAEGILAEERAALLGHLVSFKHRRQNRRKGLFGMRPAPVRAASFYRAPAARPSRSGLRLAPESARGDQADRHSIDRFPDFSARG